MLIVGAGLSGIGAGCHLQRESPGKTYAILEARDAIGGTWDLFRYPGIRSDSDMFTLGYSFKPWTDPQSIADGDSILRYIRETAREYGVDRQIRFGLRVVRADWSGADGRWTVTAQRTDSDMTVRMTCGFLLCTTGYYRYDEGYTPDFKGTDRFAGTIVHPQHWPEDLDHAGKRVVVIGSGATAVTLVPALARTAEHVTMLQRSPTWIVSRPTNDGLARRLRRVLPERAVYGIVRWKSVALTMLSFVISRRRPAIMRRILRDGLEAQLPPGYDIDTHFTPRYQPWDQRLCVVPDGDLFKAIRSGRASVVTDTIETFTEEGIELSSGEVLPADVIVTATGLNLIPLGGMQLAVDGHAVVLPETMTYKGMMLAGVPNLAVVNGYTNASWTLKCDLTCEYVCRLLNHMDAHGQDTATPQPDPSVEPRPIIDFSSGYVLRSIDRFPKQGSKTPWALHQNYARDLVMLRFGAIEDGVMRFSASDAARRGSDRLAA